MDEPKLYPAASLETAACLWEEVLRLRPNRPDILRAIGNLGSSQLRLTVLGWTDQADKDWALVRDTSWDEPFDWEWIPRWIERNVDWTGNAPALKPRPLLRPIPPGRQMDSWKQWRLHRLLNEEAIQRALPNVPIQTPSSDEKVQHRWEFTLDGQDCAIWDYEGRRWSAFGPRHALERMGFAIEEDA